MTTQNQASRCSPSVASEAARTLLGLFRKGDAEDPDTYVAGIAAMIAKYPEGIAKRVCGPFGIAAMAKFLPTLSEVRDACEQAMRPRYEAMDQEAQQRRVAAQLEERRKWEEAREQTNRERILAVHDRYKRDKNAADAANPDRFHRKRWEPREAGTIPPIGPEHADDLRRLMATSSAKG